MSNNNIGAFALLTLMVSLPLHVVADTAESTATYSAGSEAATAATQPKNLNLSLPAENSVPVGEKKTASTKKQPTANKPADNKKLQLSLRETPKQAKKKKVSIYTPPTLKAVVDLEDQRMRVYVGGQLEHTWKVSTARRGYVTPNGTFKPQWLSRMHYSRKYDNSPMPYSVFYQGGYAIHGTNAVSRLGRPASHGCVRLHTNNARKFFNLVRKHGKSNSRVVVVGSSPSYRSNPTRLASSTSYSYSNRGSYRGFSIFGRNYDRNPRRERRSSNRSNPWGNNFFNH